MQLGTTTPAAATLLLENMELLIPLEGMVDRQAELARLSSALQKRSLEQERLQAKLSNPGFIARAPQEVVAQERDKLTRCLADQQKLQQ